MRSPALPVPCQRYLPLVRDATLTRAKRARRVFFTFGSARRLGSFFLVVDGLPCTEISTRSLFCALGSLAVPRAGVNSG